MRPGGKPASPTSFPKIKGYQTSRYQRQPRQNPSRKLTVMGAFSDDLMIMAFPAATAGMAVQAAVSQKRSPEDGEDDPLFIRNMETGPGTIPQLFVKVRNIRTIAHRSMAGSLGAKRVSGRLVATQYERTCCNSVRFMQCVVQVARCVGRCCRLCRFR